MHIWNSNVEVLRPWKDLNRLNDDQGIAIVDCAAKGVSECDKYLLFAWMLEWVVSYLLFIISHLSNRIEGENAVSKQVYAPVFEQDKYLHWNT